MRDATTEKAVWWDNNKPMSPEQFELLWADFREHAQSRELFVQDLFAGADPAHRLNARIFTEYAWHALFIRHLLRRPTAAELAGFVPEFTVVNLPSFKADPKRHGVRIETVIACNFAKRLVLIGGTSYAGETKKSVFTYPQLRHAREGRDAHALLGQRRPRRRRGGVLRPVGHRQDDAVGRPQAHAARRRRARLVARTASSISRAAATPRPSACRRRPSPRSGPPPTASARCWRTSSSIRRRACPTSTTAG